MQSLIPLLALICLGFGACQIGTTDKKPASTNKVVDTIQIVERQTSQKSFSLDEFYQSYISEDLQSYIEKTHSSWSVPNRNLWYPQLFNKYKTNSSLVNYIRGDLDCNGETDYALIVDKGKNILSAVAFLSFDGNFKTAELTELGNVGEKINYTLTLYRPGRYDIADPDLDSSDARFVNLKCSSIGVGHFKELYEGGDDVYYWQQGELRSCVIDK